RSSSSTGTTAHSRTSPARNSFRYPVYYLAVDLAELDELDAGLKRFSHNRPNLTSIWDRDHGPRDGSPLRPWIDDLCARAGVDLTGGRVVLLTFPRVLGARFYPVSFWYCYGADGTVRAVLAEVHNTFRDHHNYLLHDGGAPFDFSATHTATKGFYVSPFMPIDGVTYRFDLSQPDGHLRVAIHDVVGGTTVLTAGIDLTARELSDSALTRTVLAHGPISVIALVRIHRQALKLWFKRVPFHPHTPPPAEETTL
ncbi:MAG: DUF1365 domain-containing protein, partial [Actinobacteria bacterium]